jgi:hypothetical protein
MPQITIPMNDVKRLVQFCQTNSLTNYFIAKDQGAYLGASTGKDNNILFYFAGCNPDKDADFYDNAHDKFGGDDFGEQLKLQDLIALLMRVYEWEKKNIDAGKKFKAVRAICWNITKRSISMKAVS